MTRSRLAFALLLALALVAPAALAQTVAAPPEGAQLVALAGGDVATWVGTPEEAVETTETRNVTLFFAAAPANATNVTSWTYAFALTPNGLDVATNATLVVANGSSGYAYTSLPATIPENASGELGYTFTATLLATYDNGTNATLGTATGSYLLRVAAPVEEPEVPSWLYVGLGVGLLGLLVAGVLVGQQRARRRRMNEGPRRSQVMREMELEKQLEKAKDPEQVQEIKAEIRQQEQVREKRRELQILEAKRADALKTLDLLRKRHEAGGLTKLQYDNMVAKKQGDLQKIEADIAQMEAEDAGGSAAS